jgi:DNA polymerase
MTRYVPPKLGRDNKVMAIGIAPSFEEEIQGEPFVGPSGRLLNEDLEDANYALPFCYKTNIFKYQLPGNEFKRYKEIGLSLEAALELLDEEIRVIKPNIILGLGDPVFTTLFGSKVKVNTHRGSILDYRGTKFVGTWHPAAELHGAGEGQWKAWQKYVRKFDIQRAVEQSAFKEFPYPERLLRICHDSTQLREYLDRNIGINPYCSVDIESIEGIPVCIGLSFNIHEAISIPLWNTVPISCTNLVSPKKSYNYHLEISKIPDWDMAYIWQALAKLFLDRRVKFIGQNFKYDEAKLNALGFYFHGLYADTLIGQHVISSELPKSLAFQTSIYTLEPYYKNEGKEYVPGRDSISDLLIYNCKDAAVTLEIFLAHKQELAEIPGATESFLNFRMKLHKVYLDMERRGFDTDDAKRTELIKKYVKREIGIEKEIYDLIGEFGISNIINFNSWQQLDKLMYEDLGIPRRKGTNERTITSLLANVVKEKRKRRILELILERRGVAKSIGTYLAAENDYDGKMKTTYQICGTESYRTSTQVVGQPLRPRDIGWALQTVTKHGDTGQDLRSILVAPPRYVFVNIDQSQAEARVCSLLAKDYETLELYDTHDIHALTAAYIFGGEETKYSKKTLGYECHERFIGKTGRHAYHLKIGKHEFMISTNTDARKMKLDLTISEYKANQILEALRKMTPKIEEVFHIEVQESLRKDRRLFGTYGASFYLHEEWGDDLFKAAYSRIPQQTVSDKTKKVAIWAAEEIWDCPVVGESHDALLFLCPIRKLHDYVPRIREEFARPIDFSNCSLSRGLLSIPTDAEVGENYQDLRKFKLNETLRIS